MGNFLCKDDYHFYFLPPLLLLILVLDRNNAMGNYPPTSYKASRKIGFNGQQRERSRRNPSKKHSLSNSVTSTSTDTHLTDDDSLREQQEQQRRSSPQQQ